MEGNIMKKFLLISVATLLTFVSCQKQVVPAVDTTSFKASISSTKTVTDITTGKITWSEKDTITITDGVNTAVYIITEITPSGYAIFNKYSGDDLMAEGEGVKYTAVYGLAPVKNQVYGTEVKDLPMVASSSTHNLVFSVSCAVLQLHLTGEDQNIKTIEVRGAVDGVPTLCDTYTLTCENAEDIAGGKDFNIVLPTGNYDRFRFIDDNGCYTIKTAKVGKSIGLTTSLIQKVSFSDLQFSTIDGLFSVAPDKRVQFTKSNLYWDGSEFKFEKNQISYPKVWSADHIAHFFWTEEASNSYATRFDTKWGKANLFCDEKHPVKVEGVEGYLLTIDEWHYLIKMDRYTGDSRKDAEDLRQFDVTVGGVEGCIVIAPDGFDPKNWRKSEKSGRYEYTLEQLNTDGLVCLPPCGYRVFNDYNQAPEISLYNPTTKQPEGTYMSASLPTGTGVTAKVPLIYFKNTDRVIDGRRIDRAYSVRLVLPETKVLIPSAGGTAQYSGAEADDWF